MGEKCPEILTGLGREGNCVGHWVPERVFAVSSMGFSRHGRDSSERES
jgi:hypothetical protein